MVLVLAGCRARRGQAVRFGRRRGLSRIMEDGDAAGKKRKRQPSEAKLLSATDGTAKMSATEKKRLSRYSRGAANKSKGVVKHRLKVGIKRSEAKISAANKRAAQAELLLPTEAGTIETEGEMEMTARMSQREVAQAVDLQTQRKAYNMKLDKFGPYRANFTPNGRHLLLGGRKGHLAIVDWERAHVKTEIHVRETVS
jgi:U3 small nucleolar RNA-associated protein 7